MELEQQIGVTFLLVAQPVPEMELRMTTTFMYLWNSTKRDFLICSDATALFFGWINEFRYLKTRENNWSFTVNVTYFKKQFPALAAIDMCILRESTSYICCVDRPCNYQIMSPSYSQQFYDWLASPASTCPEEDIDFYLKCKSVFCVDWAEYELRSDIGVCHKLFYPLAEPVYSREAGRPSQNKKTKDALETDAPDYCLPSDLHSRTVHLSLDDRTFQVWRNTLSICCNWQLQNSQSCSCCGQTLHMIKQQITKRDCLSFWQMHLHTWWEWEKHNYRKVG